MSNAVSFLCFHSGHSGGYDGRSVPPYPFPQGRESSTARPSFLAPVTSQMLQLNTRRDGAIKGFMICAYNNLKEKVHSCLFTSHFCIFPGAYPPPMAGGVPPPWPPMMDNTKSWDYYSRREDKREKDRERPRERTHEREREREHSPSAMSYTRSEAQTQRYVVYAADVPLLEHLLNISGLQL